MYTYYIESPKKIVNPNTRTILKVSVSRIVYLITLVNNFNALSIKKLNKQKDKMVNLIILMVIYYT